MSAGEPWSPLTDPTHYKCCACKELFEACDAVHDYLIDEGYLDLCPYCGSEELDDRYDAQDPEIPEIDSILEDAAERYSDR